MTRIDRLLTDSGRYKIDSFVRMLREEFIS